jgi:outer membrane protein assembly factor BamB
MKHDWLWVPVLMGAADAAAPDWNGFRGPGAQGEVPAETRLPLEWSATRGVVWRTEVPGLGWSSPVVGGGRIFLTTAVSADGNDEAPGTVDRSLRALCLDGTSGKLLWDREVFLQKGGAEVKVHKKNSHASPTPLVEEGKLFVHFGPHGTACLDFEGTVIWKNGEIDYSPVHGNGGSPVLVDGRLIFSCDGPPDPFVVALDARTGAVAWKTPRNTAAKRAFSFSTPLVIGSGKDREVVLPGSGNLYAYDPASGEERWRCNWGEGYSVVPRPVYGHGLVFASSGYDRPVLFAVRPGGKGDVTTSHVAWTADKAVPRNASFVVAGEHLFTVDDKGVGTCYAAKTGEVKWQERIGSDTSASLLHHAGRIYVLDELGTCTVVEAGPEFRVLATNELGERALASMGVIGNDLLVRTAEALYRIGS